MTRPCTCDRLPPEGQPYSLQYCKLCWLYHNDAAYRNFWNAMPQTVKQTMPSPPPPPSVEKLLGDLVEETLSSVGITEERITAWVGRLCGCAKRKELLNKLHLWAKSAHKHGVREAMSQLKLLVTGKA